MIVHNFDPVLIDFGLFQIRWYSIAYILGIVLGWVYAIKVIIKRKKNTNNFEIIKKSDFDDLIIYLVLGIVLGGRLGYVIFYNLEYYIQNLSEIFMVWQGGMSFHGGLLGIVLSILLFSKNKNTSFFKYSDVIACVSPIGLFFGRIANFINGELYGKYSNLPWSVIFPNIDNLPRHPSQIYEAILEGVVLFLIINFFAFKNILFLRKGLISCLFLIIYSILRIIGEIFRSPDEQIGYIFNFLSMGSLLSLLTLVAGILVFIKLKNHEQNNCSFKTKKINSSGQVYKFSSI